MSKHQTQSDVASKFENRAILFIVDLAKMFKSQSVAILLGQLLYWEGKQKRMDRFIYKTAQEMYDETSLTGRQQTRAINILIEYRILEYKLKGLPAKRHFKIKLQILHYVITSYNNTGKLPSPKTVMLYEQNVESITETTQRKKSRENAREHTPRVSRAASPTSQNSAMPINQILANYPFSSLFDKQD